MVSFFKRFFQPKIREEKVSRSEIKEWFYQKVSACEEEVNSIFSQSKKDILTITDEISQMLAHLQTLDLYNPNITIREKQFMEGNRRSYIQRTEFFIKELAEILEFDAIFFLERYKEYMDNYAKSTTRSYAILQEFFANEARDIARKIKEIDNIVSDLRLDGKIIFITKVNDIKKSLVSIEHKELKIKELEAELRSIQGDIEYHIVQKQDTLKQKQDLESSSDYKLLKSFEDKKNEIDEKVRLIVGRLNDDFSVIDKQLRKFEHSAIDNQSLIRFYIEDPVKGLTSDFQLKILDILQQVQNFAQKSDIELKVFEKISGKISEMDREYFQDFLRSYNFALNNRSELEHRLAENAAKKELEAIQTNLTNIDIKLALANKRIFDIQEERNSINLDLLREEARKDIESAMQIKLAWC